ncbi:hypothetical protein LZ30DRAFT_135630 [Colletotrichum cereale]|nr:hypothetical protein LZ30DRAFT_135630 [Colletotrichum cereale]
MTTTTRMQQDTTSQSSKCPKERDRSCRHEADEQNRTVNGSTRTPKLSRARPPMYEGTISRTFEEDFYRGPTPKTGRLWNPDEGPSRAHDASCSPRPRGPFESPRKSFKPRPVASDTEIMIKQPETRPISQEQLVAEVKGIYAGLVMVESKCIEVDEAQSSASMGESEPRLNNEQWQALIALHHTLLHEHHDFFLASQHPSASPALHRLASKDAMPARMWRYGIHSFLELLRHQLPDSSEHMLSFIHLAYSMMALFHETVPTFKDTWIECLGDLGRYWMAIEDDDCKDREVWTSVSRHWYIKASDKAPMAGRLYHHLVILAGPKSAREFFKYTKSHLVHRPFLSARESIMKLFEPPFPSQIDGLTEANAAFDIVDDGLLNRKYTYTLTRNRVDNLNSPTGLTAHYWAESGDYVGTAISEESLRPEGYTFDNDTDSLWSHRPQVGSIESIRQLAVRIDPYCTFSIGGDGIMTWAESNSTRKFFLSVSNVSGEFNGVNRDPINALPRLNKKSRLSILPEEHVSHNLLTRERLILEKRRSLLQRFGRILEYVLCHGPVIFSRIDQATLPDDSMRQGRVWESKPVLFKWFKGITINNEKLHHGDFSAQSRQLNSIPLDNRKETQDRNIENRNELVKRRPHLTDYVPGPLSSFPSTERRTWQVVFDKLCQLSLARASSGRSDSSLDIMYCYWSRRL